MAWKRVGRVTDPRQRRLAMLWPYSDIEVPDTAPPPFATANPAGAWRQTARFGRLDRSGAGSRAGSRALKASPKPKAASPGPSKPSPKSPATNGSNANAALRRRCEAQGKFFNPVTRRCNTLNGSSHRAYLASVRRAGRT